MTVDDFKRYVDEKRERTSNLLSAYDTAISNKVKHDLAEKYQRGAKSENYKNDYIAVNTHDGKSLLPVLNNLVMVSEIRAFQIQQVDYKDRFTVFRTLDQELDYESSNSRVVDFIREFDSITQFPDKMKLLCTSDFSEYEISEVLELLPILYKNYYLTLGKSKIKALCYKKYLLDKEFNKRVANQNNSNNIDDLVYSTFEVGKKYLKTEIKQVLGNIYKEAGVVMTPKASDLEKYFELGKIQITNKETGKRDNGYIILKIKE